jgi:hypothetical protein
VTLKQAKDLKRIRWFENHSRITIIFVVLILIITIDLLCGIFLIKKDVNNFRSKHHYYHHGMFPSTVGKSKWGNSEIYSVFTNSLGFLDSSTRDIKLNTFKKRIVFIGDSYVEGLGVPFNKTFIGLLNKNIEHSRIELLNAAVLSYSPKLYYLKIKYLIETVGLKFDELYVFIDISDVQDEILYRRYEPSEKKSGYQMLSKMRVQLKNISFLVYSIDMLYQKKRRQEKIKKYNPQYYPPWLDYFWLDNQDTEPFADPAFISIRSDWTTDEYFENRWTQLGLKLAFDNMNKLLQLCRENNIKMYITVYPWPSQIFRQELESRQVTVWRQYSNRNKITFINLFPDFIKTSKLSPEHIYSKYYIQGDIHWNLEGHRLVAKKLLSYMYH